VSVHGAHTGLGAEHAPNGLPCHRRGLTGSHLLKNIARQKKAHNLLVQGHPTFMRWIGSLDLLLSSCRDEVFLRHRRCAKQEPFEACTAHNKQHLCLPEDVVVVGQLLRDDMAKERVGGSGTSLP
jgi:hypothetical protein